MRVATEEELAAIADMVDIPAFELPEWVLDLSPFRHLAAVPAADMNVAAAIVMLAVGIAAAAIGATRGPSALAPATRAADTESYRAPTILSAGPITRR